jgi:isopenicillin N synthase-like dioxygenase
MTDLQARTRDLDRGDLAAKDVDFETIPIVDVAGLFSSDMAERRRVAAEIGRACENVGFMYLVNHGIPLDEFERCWDTMHRFFALSQEEKLKCDIRNLARHRGYVVMGGLNADPHKPGKDLQEAFEIGLELPENDADYLAGNMIYGPNVWPEDPDDFAPVLYGWYERCRVLGQALFRGFALALAMPEEFFDDKISKPMAQLRAIHYPRQEAFAQSSADIGIGAHTDYECFTILAQSASGLHVRNRAGEWIAAPPIEGALIINIGDMMERWTNDRFVSTVHRVVNSSGRKRFSLAFFFGANYGTVVECLPTCQSPDNPPRYTPTIAGEWTVNNIKAAYAYKPSLGARG